MAFNANPKTPAKGRFSDAWPASGDSIKSSAAWQNQLLGLYEADLLPLRPKAHGNSPSSGDTGIMVLGTDSSQYFVGVYIGAVPYTPASGDVTGFTPFPTTNARIDLVFASGDGVNLTYRVTKGVEAGTPVAPKVSGDVIPICHIYQKVGATRILNFENRNASSGDSYIIRDVRPLYGNPTPTLNYGVPAVNFGTTNATGSGDALKAGGSVALYRTGYTPATLIAGSVGAYGGSRFAARDDHEHPVQAGTPVLNLTTSNAQGSGDFLRAGAQIALFGLQTPQAVGTAAIGGSPKAAHEDHSHGGSSGNFESVRLSETADFTAEGSNSTDLSVTVDVTSYVIVIVTGEFVTADTTAAITISIRRDGTVKQASQSIDRTPGGALCLSWSETLTAGTYAFDLLSAGSASNNTSLKYQMQIIAIPAT